MIFNGTRLNSNAVNPQKKIRDINKDRQNLYNLIRDIIKDQNTKQKQVIINTVKIAIEYIQKQHSIMGNIFSETINPYKEKGINEELLTLLLTYDEANIYNICLVSICQSNSSFLSSFLGNSSTNDVGQLLHELSMVECCDPLRESYYNDYTDLENTPEDYNQYKNETCSDSYGRPREDYYQADSSDDGTDILFNSELDNLVENAMHIDDPIKYTKEFGNCKVSIVNQSSLDAARSLYTEFNEIPTIVTVTEKNIQACYKNREYGLFYNEAIVPCPVNSEGNYATFTNSEEIDIESKIKDQFEVLIGNNCKYVVIHDFGYMQDVCLLHYVARIYAKYLYEYANNFTEIVFAIDADYVINNINDKVNKKANTVYNVIDEFKHVFDHWQPLNK